MYDVIATQDREVLSWLLERMPPHPEATWKIAEVSGTEIYLVLMKPNGDYLEVIPCYHKPPPSKLRGKRVFGDLPINVAVGIGWLQWYFVPRAPDWFKQSRTRTHADLDEVGAVLGRKITVTVVDDVAS